MVEQVRSPSTPAAAAFDVLCVGTVFLDIIFTGLPAPPRLGTEVWAEGMGSSPGGVANAAVALNRLGLRTALAAPFGADAYGDFCWEVLREQEGVDLSMSRRFSGWHSPLTVSLAYERDRAMVTHGHPAPVPFDEIIGSPPSVRAVVTSLAQEPEDWLLHARREGALVIADVAWDPIETWAPEVLQRLAYCDAFLPNAAEAMAYTNASTPEAAIARLADLVPVAVVTLGRDGALAVDGNTGEYVRVAALPVEALDPTGAGDIFVAGFTAATLAGWPLGHRVRFATLCSALAVQDFGGSLSAPGWADLLAWWRGIGQRDPKTARDYSFLAEVLPEPCPASTGARATATIGFRSAR